MSDSTDHQPGSVVEARSGTPCPLAPRPTAIATRELAVQRLRTLLSLTASPVFGALAVITYLSPGLDICSTAGGSHTLGGMSAMYILMCLFHLDAWLKRLTPAHVSANGARSR